MSERIRGSYDDALYKSTYTLLYFTSVCAATEMTGTQTQSAAIPRDENSS